MRSVNKVILVGNLTRDPEMRQTPNGQNVTTFGMATNREWVTSDSDKKSSAEFHECVAWAKLAEICANYLKKGSLVYVEGYLKTRSWDTPEGIKKFKTEIVVQDMIMLEKRKDSDEYVPSDQQPDYNDDYGMNDMGDSSSAGSSAGDDNTGDDSSVGDDTAQADTSQDDSSHNPIDKDLGL